MKKIIIILLLITNLFSEELCIDPKDHSDLLSYVDVLKQMNNFYKEQINEKTENIIFLLDSIEDLEKENRKLKELLKDS